MNIRYDDDITGIDYAILFIRISIEYETENIVNNNKAALEKTNNTNGVMELKTNLSELVIYVYYRRFISFRYEIFQPVEFRLKMTFSLGCPMLLKCTY